MTATEAKTHLLSLLDDAENGQQIEITRHGRTVARIVPARGAVAVEGSMVGIAWTADPNDDLLTTGQDWVVQAD